MHRSELLANWHRAQLQLPLEDIAPLDDIACMPDNRILRIKAASVCGPYHLDLMFSDGVSKQVDVKPLLRGPVMAPLTDESYFARVTLDTLSGTVSWPNGADFAPEALYDLPSIRD